MTSRDKTFWLHAAAFIIVSVASVIAEYLNDGTRWATAAFILQITVSLLIITHLVIRLGWLKRLTEMKNSTRPGKRAVFPGGPFLLLLIETFQ